MEPRVVARRTRPLGSVPGALLALALAAGCAGDGGEPRSAAPGPAASSGAAGPASTGAPRVPRTSLAPSTAPATPATSPAATPGTAAPEPLASDGRPRRALLTIRALDIVDLVVQPYRGWTDDAPGTAIQDRGIAASPHGPRGGTGPGGVGNYQVTAHRLSSTRAFEFLPRLEPGAKVVVEAGGARYVYEITRTRWTSFRSARSLRAQRAAVPGRPGVEPTRAMITLSTCATVEDHARGNYWSDQFGNPEHRIDKIGKLVAIRR